MQPPHIRDMCKFCANQLLLVFKMTNFALAALFLKEQYRLILVWTVCRVGRRVSDSPRCRSTAQTPSSCPYLTL